MEACDFVRAPRRTKRRRRLTRAREESFLAALAGTCDTKGSAAAAGVHKATVHRRIQRDPGFARASSEALERGYDYLARVEEEEKAAARERLRAAWEELPDRDFEAASERLREMDFDQMMRLLERWDRARGRRRPPTIWETIAKLEERLEKVFGPRRGEESGGDPLRRAEDWLPPE